MSNIRTNSGGSAMAGGQRYQAAVTVWWMVKILLQSNVSQQYQLTPATVPERINSETTDAVDDLRVDLDHDYKIFGQCKRSLTLSGKPDSDLASVLKQFFLETERAGAAGKKRFVLYYEENNGNFVKLSNLLNRYRHLESGKNLIDAAVNQEEKKIVDNLELLFDQIQKEKGFEKLKGKRNIILRQMFIHQLQLNDTGPHKEFLTGSVQHSLLKNSSNGELALTVLHRLADDLMADREGRDALALRAKLVSSGIDLRDNINFRSDFERLEEWSNTELQTHESEGRTKIKIGTQKITINRPVTEVILKTAKTDSFLVIGDAGIGKTGCLHAVAGKLRKKGSRVWYWAADSLPHISVQEMASHLLLENTWMAIFAEAAATGESYLIIDGLDGLRDSQVQKAYRQLVNLAMRAGIKVIASIRKFDLRYAGDLSESFPSRNWLPGSKHTDPAFQKIKHISVAELTDSEYRQIFAALPQIKPILKKSPDLLKVVHNLFSLDLLCKLVDDNESAEELSLVSTQAELFDRYWTRRIDSLPIREEMETALAQLVDKMVQEQSLQAVPETGSLIGQVKQELFSQGIIRNPPQILGRMPKEKVVEFNHHLMFDYVAERLFVRLRKDVLESEWSSKPNWGLFLRPSIVLFFRYLWSEGRLDYWETLELLQKSAAGILQLMPAYLVAAQEIASFDDLRHLIDSFEKDTDSNVWIEIIQQIISAATFSKLPELFSKSAGEYWIEFAQKLIQTGNIPLVYAGSWLLSTASNNFDDLNSSSKKLFSDAVIDLFNFQFAPGSLQQDITFALKWVCRTIKINPSQCSAIIRRLITADELKKTGYITAREIAGNTDIIRLTDPALAVEIYDALFKHVETDGSQISIGSTVAGQLTMNRVQLYQTSQFALVEKFGGFLTEDPANATKSLILVLGNFQNQSEEDLITESGEATPPLKTFEWDGVSCRLRPTKQRYFSLALLDRHKDDDKLIEKWEKFLEKLPVAKKSKEIWTSIKDVLASENDIARIWLALLEAGKENPLYFARLLWTILANSSVLINSTLYQAAEDCITKFAPYLTKKNLALIENAVFSIDESFYPNINKEAVEEYLKIVKAQLLLRFPENLRSQKSKKFLKNCSKEILDRASVIKVPAPEQVFRRMDHEPSPFDSFRELYDLANSLVDYSDPELTAERASRIIQNLESLETKIQNSNTSIPSDILDIFQSRMIGCLRWLSVSGLPLDEQIIDKASKVLLEKLAEPQNAPSEDELRRFDQRQSWNPENSWTNAAEGFIYLLARKREITEADKKILRSIIDSPIPIIRMMAGRNFFRLLDKAEDLVRETLAKWLIQLPTQSGTAGVLNETLNTELIVNLRSRNETATNQFIKDLFAVSKSSKADSLLTKCGNLIADLGLLDNIQWANDIITEELKNIPQNLNQLRGMIQITNPIVFNDDPNEKVTPEQRTRLIEFIKKFLRATIENLNQYFDESQRLTQSGIKPEETPLWVKEAVRFLEQFTRQIESSVKRSTKSHQEADKSEIICLVPDWWNEIEPLFEELIKFPHPPLMFHLIEAIRHVMSSNGEKALYWLRRITLESAPQGLTGDRLVADTTIEILEKILAEHKGSLKNDSQMQSDFIQILEAYLKVGFERAVTLALKIESIFR